MAGVTGLRAVDHDLQDAAKINEAGGMFVVEARSARIELTDRQQLRTVVRVVQEAGFLGLVESMLVSAERVARLGEGVLDTDWLSPQPNSPMRRPLPEIFFGTGSLFVMASTGARVDAWEVRRQDQPSALDEFCEALNAAADAAGVPHEDGESTQWQPRTLQLHANGADVGDEIDAPAAESPAADPAAAQALADDDARSFITDLVRTGSSITDFDDSPMSQYRSVSELYRQGLIEREYLIVCRQDHRTLGRVSTMDDDAQRSILQLSCPTCGRRFNEELLRQVHAPSRTAVELVTDGRWRATWALSLLRDHGFEDRDITRLAGSGGNGVALRVDTLHGRLLVELPEAEFGMQHAYALIRRLRRQSIDFGLVLATEPVADEAYQYLSERVSHDQGPLVSVLEGSRSVVHGLGEALDEWSVISVRLLAEELLDSTGIDFGAVIEAWMRQHADAELDLRDDDHATVTELTRVSGQ